MSILKVEIANIFFEIKIVISARKGEVLKGEEIMATSSFYPSYQTRCLKRELLVKGKINALLDRTKPRDLFDLYFILRKMWKLDLTKEQIENMC